LAIYAADIQINVKNKGDLKKLENRFKQINIAAVSLNKTLKGLGRRNAIKVDTRAAMSAISALEARIRGLNRTVRVDARTSGGGGDSGGMSGAAIPLAAGVFGGGRRQQKQSVKTRDLLDIGQGAMSAHIQKLNQDIKLQQSIVENYGETAKRSQDKYAQAIENVNKHQATSKKQLKDLDKVIKNQPWAKFSKGFLPKTAGDNFLKFATAYLRTNSKINDEITNTNKELVDQATHQKKINEVAQSNLKGQEKELNFRKQILKATEKEQDQTIQRALMSDREIDLHKQINQEKVKGFNAFSQQLKHQEKINGELLAGRQPAEALTRQFEAAKRATKDAFGNVVRLREELSKPARTGGLLGSFKDLGKKGAMGAAGRGALASSALIPGVAPLAVGGFAGAAGGGGLAGGAIGVAIAGAVTGATAFLEFAKSATVVASEMDRMRTALSGVVPDQESYNTSIEKVTKLSNKYGISQRTLLKGFTQLQASADAAGFDVKETGDLMEGLLARTLASGKGLEEFKGVMLAASQILSKGKLQAEEARGQIGERIPGFMADLAASMNISMKELDKAMEQGEVTLEDFFKLGEDLLKNNEKIATKLAQSYANAGQRLTTAMENLQAAMGPGLSIAGAQFQSFSADVINGLTEMAKSANSKELQRLERIIEIMNKGGLRGKLMEWTHGSKDKIEEQRSVISGEKIIDERARREKAAKEKADAASWNKIEKQLNSQLQYQKDLNEKGQEYADTQKMINDLLKDFPDKSEEINKLVKALKDVEKQGKSTKAVLNDWLDELEERLKELKNPMEQFKTLVEAAGDSFQSDFKEMIRGTMSVGDAFVNMFNRIADAYLDMVAEMIANQAKQRLIGFVGNIIGGGIGGGSGGMSWSSSVNAPSMGYGYGDLSSSVSQFKLASGGYVDRPTNALIGEAGPEYVLRDDQMQGALARYASGQRGQSVIPGSSYSDQPSGGGGGVTVSYTGPTLNFNGDEYVPKSSVPQIINAAAKQGASAGQAKALSSLKNSRSARSRVGI